MKNASRYREYASLCRQRAAYDPEKSWYLLGQAERWEHRAEEAISDYLNECNAIRASGHVVCDLAA